MAQRLVKVNALWMYIPFCGGTWVRSALAAAGVETEEAVQPDGNEAWHGLARQFVGEFDRKVVFVRHPLKWYESYYVRFRALSTGEPERSTAEPLTRVKRFLPFGCLQKYCHQDFDHFISNCIERQPGFVSRMYEWYAGPPGGAGVDYVGRQENLAENFLDVMDKLGYELDREVVRSCPPVNVREPVTVEWNETLKAELLRRERPALDRFFANGDLSVLERPQ